MTKRIKRPTVKPEMRRMWLRRNEEDGESPPQIAASDGFDVRTVRKQIEMAKQEREIREARSIVLRNALEEHYRDLCKYADFLSRSVFSNGRISVEGGSPTVDVISMNTALRQHLPRSPIWRDLNRLEQLNGKITELEAEVKQEINNEVGKEKKLVKILAAGENQVIDGITAVLAFQLKAWVQEQKGLNIGDNFKVKSSGEGMVYIEYGFAHIGKVQEEHIQDIIDVLTDFESRIVDWEQFDSMKKLFTDLKRVRSSLQEELAVIINRRIVPGKCKYCPI